MTETINTPLKDHPETDPHVIVQVPARAIASEDDAPAKDLSPPVTQLLHDLNLLPTKAELDEAGGPFAAIAGPPQGVAIIEAGAASASKAWAALMAAGGAAIWTSVGAFWDGQGPATQRVSLWGAAIATAALALAISYILGSDVRGRAAAMVATIDARASVTRSLIEASTAATSTKATAAAPVATVLVLPEAREARHTSEVGTQAEMGWVAFLKRGDGDDLEYGIVKDTTFKWVKEDALLFE